MRINATIATILSSRTRIPFPRTFLPLLGLIPAAIAQRQEMRPNQTDQGTRTVRRPLLQQRQQFPSLPSRTSKSSQWNNPPKALINRQQNRWRICIPSWIKSSSPMARITKNSIKPIIMYTKMIEGPAKLIVLPDPINSPCRWHHQWQWAGYDGWWDCAVGVLRLWLGS